MCVHHHRDINRIQQNEKRETPFCTVFIRFHFILHHFRHIFFIPSHTFARRCLPLDMDMPNGNIHRMSARQRSDAVRDRKRANREQLEHPFCCMQCGMIHEFQARFRFWEFHDTHIRRLLLPSAAGNPQDSRAFGKAPGRSMSIEHLQGASPVSGKHS